MYAFINNSQFIKDYQSLKRVSLNPERHTAANAYEHCEMVVDRVKELSELNNLNPDQVNILVALAKVHDIGKCRGDTKPDTSVKLLQEYGCIDDDFIQLVKYHDINLPWYISKTKGQTPTDKAWRKLSRKVEMRLLCIFMIADRVDCPGGWQANKALVWFLDEHSKKFEASVFA